MRLSGSGVLVVEKVYSEIKNKILTGEFLPGQHLIEADLAEGFKVSRVTIRDALRRLVYDELVDLKPNSGIWVRRLSYQEIVDLYAVREPIEILVARLAAQQQNENLLEIKDICSEGAVAVANMDRMSHRRINHRFHTALALSTGNRTLVKILERLNTQMIANQFMPLLRDDDFKISQLDHEELVEAIFIGDSDHAELVMGRHVRKGRDFALSSFPSSLK